MSDFYERVQDRMLRPYSHGGKIQERIEQRVGKIIERDWNRKFDVAEKLMVGLDKKFISRRKEEKKK